MYKGKRVKKRSKAPVLLTALLLSFGQAAGKTGAYLLSQSGSAENTFTPAEVTCEVTATQTADDTSASLSDVCILNTGETDTYIRAAIIVNWQDKEGNISSQTPKEGDNVDYKLELDLSDGWSEGSDGYYYYSVPVAPGVQTGPLINSLEDFSGTDSSALHIEVLAEAIQSAPIEAVQNTWGVIVTDGIISK